MPECSKRAVRHREMSEFEKYSGFGKSNKRDGSTLEDLQGKILLLKN